jgi:hypothetical protein
MIFTLRNQTKRDFREKSLATGSASWIDVFPHLPLNCGIKPGIDQPG